MGYPDEHVVQAKITIQRIDPPIWRQLLLPLALNLAGLHEIIQAAFGWTDSHLHQFIIGGLIYGAPEFDEDGQSTHATFEATDVLLRDFDLFHVRNPEFLYEYDFGDGWMHLIEFESTRPIDPDINYPICIAGARHGPPEDVGGVTGYADFLETWSNPEHEEHRTLRTWVGRRFSPEKFDPTLPTRRSDPPSAKPAADTASASNPDRPQKRG